MKPKNSRGKDGKFLETNAWHHQGRFTCAETRAGRRQGSIHVRRSESRDKRGNTRGRISCVVTRAWKSKWPIHEGEEANVKEASVEAKAENVSREHGRGNAGRGECRGRIHVQGRSERRVGSGGKACEQPGVSASTSRKGTGLARRGLKNHASSRV